MKKVAYSADQWVVNLVVRKAGMLELMTAASWVQKTAEL